MTPALEKVSRAVDLSPGFDLARDFLIRLLMQMNRLPEALEHAKVLIRSPVQSTGNDMILASVLVRLGRDGFSALLIGATDVRSGDRVVFGGETLTNDQLVASAAVPPLFRAVPTEGHLCWDGLFSTNPPIREFTDVPAKPSEIWVVQINPQRREREPRLMRDIIVVDDVRCRCKDVTGVGRCLYAACIIGIH